MKRALVLVEGSTESNFVKQVLLEYFLALGLHLAPTIARTKQVVTGRDFRGGVTSFGKFKNDLSRLIYSRGDALVTTMIDYYRLPPDFPALGSRATAPALERVQQIEEAIRNHFGAPPNFIPYLSLHEFEALLFASPDDTARSIAVPNLAGELSAIRAAFDTPEDINDRPEFAPSKRILGVFPGYQKTLHGPVATRRIGLARLRAECAHFNAWITEMEAFAAH